MGRDAAADDPAAERGDRHEAGVERVRAGGAGGQDQVERVRPADEAGHRGLDRVGVVLDVLDGHDLRAEALDLGPDARLEPLARGGPDRLLDDDPDPARHERRDPDERVAAEAGQPRAGIDRRRIDEVRRHLDARDEVAARDDLAVERGEDLERVDPVEPLEVGDPDVEDAVRLGDEVDPALGRTARSIRPGPATAAARRMAASSSCSSPGSGTRTLTGSPGSAAGERGQVVRASAAGPSTSASPETVRSRARIGPDEARGHATPRGDAMDLHAAAGTVGRPT